MRSNALIWISVSSPPVKSVPVDAVSVTPASHPPKLAILPEEPPPRTSERTGRHDVCIITEPWQSYPAKKARYMDTALLVVLCVLALVHSSRGQADCAG